MKRKALIFFSHPSRRLSYIKLVHGEGYEKESLDFLFISEPPKFGAFLEYTSSFSAPDFNSRLFIVH